MKKNARGTQRNEERTDIKVYLRLEPKRLFNNKMKVGMNMKSNVKERDLDR